MKLAKQMIAQGDVTSFTFEGNLIRDEASVCALFQNLKSFERLESINIRANKFTHKIIDALCEGIVNKKELRVSQCFLMFMLSIHSFVLDR